jgi:hypothetical protein
MDEMLMDPYVPRTQVSTDSKFFCQYSLNINILKGFTSKFKDEGKMLKCLIVGKIPQLITLEPEASWDG